MWFYLSLLFLFNPLIDVLFHCIKGTTDLLGSFLHFWQTIVHHFRRLARYIVPLPKTFGHYTMFKVGTDKQHFHFSDEEPDL